jgi:hypothetical protein
VFIYAAIIASLVLSGRALPGTSLVGATTGPTSAEWICTGTKFFNSAGVGATFHEGSVHNGGTFTYIENDNYMEVRDNPESGFMGYIVGEFEQPARIGDDATIVFDRQIQIVSIYWWDNDPKEGEAGWSFNGIAGPVTGEKASAITAVNLVTDTVNISAGGDSGGVDFCYVEVNGGDEGCTPGYWKNHVAAWAGTGYSPNQLVSSVFTGANAMQANKTLLQALNFGGGSGVDGAEQTLLRAAVASLLNAAHSGVDFSMTTAEIISQVNAALATDNRATILALAATLDAANNEGCPL